MTIDDLNSKAGKGKGKSKRKGASEKENVAPTTPLATPVGDEGGQDNERRQSLNSTGEMDEVSFHVGEPRPMGNKTAKKLKGEECSQRMSAYAQRDMVAINSKRLKLLEEQSQMNLFSLRADDLDEDSREYFRLCRARELKSFKKLIESEEQEERSQRPTASRSSLPVHHPNNTENTGDNTNRNTEDTKNVYRPDPAPNDVPEAEVLEQGFAQGSGYSGLDLSELDRMLGD
ncbi:unnamed protein product [Calypogeia fissa]